MRACIHGGERGGGCELNCLDILPEGFRSTQGVINKRGIGNILCLPSWFGRIESTTRIPSHVSLPFRYHIGSTV